MPRKAPAYTNYFQTPTLCSRSQMSCIPQRLLVFFWSERTLEVPLPSVAMRPPQQIRHRPCLGTASPPMHIWSPLTLRAMNWIYCGFNKTNFSMVLKRLTVCTGCPSKFLQTIPNFCFTLTQTGTVVLPFPHQATEESNHLKQDSHLPENSTQSIKKQ